MVLPPSTAPEGEAAEAEWLRELRRWLHLGRKGVIIMIRDAQPARIREFALALESIEPGYMFEVEAERLLEAPEGGLVALAVREQDLDWLNLNRPIVSQRSLRVVLWVEAAVSEVLKFRSPDLHDWISHFVACPPGVPEFAVDELRRCLKQRDLIVWRGPGLNEALTSLDVKWVEGVAKNAVWVSDGGLGVTSVRDVASMEQLLEIEGAMPPGDRVMILENPKIWVRGWILIDARQTSLEEAAWTLGKSGVPEPVKFAALAELRPALLDLMHLFEHPPKRAKEVMETVTAVLAVPAGRLLLDEPLDFEEIVEFFIATLDRQDTDIDMHLPSILYLARRTLGSGDQGFAVRRCAGLVYAIAGHLEPATEHLSATHDEWLHTRSPKLAGVGSELAAVLYLRGRYTEALTKFDAPTGEAENLILVAAQLAVGGGSAPSDDSHASYDDVIAFLRARLHETKTRV